MPPKRGLSAKGKQQEEPETKVAKVPPKLVELPSPLNEVGGYYQHQYEW